MILCPVCSHQNDEFALRCVSCSSFIQDRIPNLDFFATIALIVEEPTAAFKKIILAEHKNYVLMLAFFLGIFSAFALYWAVNFGNEFDNILPLLIGGAIASIVIALPLFFCLAFLIHFCFKVFGGKGSFKNSYAVTGWSCVPLSFSIIFVLPIELATIGLYFFSSNPSGYQYKPVVYSALLGLNGISVLWSVALLGIGMSIAHRKSLFFSLCVSVLLTAAVSAGTYYGFHNFYY